MCILLRSLRPASVRSGGPPCAGLLSSARLCQIFCGQGVPASAWASALRSARLCCPAPCLRSFLRRVSPAAVSGGQAVTVRGMSAASKKLRHRRSLPDPARLSPDLAQRIWRTGQSGQQGNGSGQAVFPAPVPGQRISTGRRSGPGRSAADLARQTVLGRPGRAGVTSSHFYTVAKFCRADGLQTWCRTCGSGPGGSGAGGPEADRAGREGGRSSHNIYYLHQKTAAGGLPRRLSCCGGLFRQAVRRRHLRQLGQVPDGQRVPWGMLPHRPWPHVTPTSTALNKKGMTDF